jgi:cytoskeletal protein RodZ
MRARIDISEVESATKIRARYLRAIENEEWELLPGPTYVKSFLRTYAEHLGLDAKLLVEEYKLRHESIVVEHESRPIGSALSDARRSRQSRRPPRVPRGVLLAAGGVAVVVLLIIIGSIGGQSDPTAPAPTVDRTTTSARKTPVASAPARKPAPTVARLAIVPQGEVYTCVRDASDKLVLSETLTPGVGKKTFKGKHFRVTVGNSAVLLTLNGKRITVQPSSTETNFEILPTRARKLGQDSNAC